MYGRKINLPERFEIRVSTKQRHALEMIAKRLGMTISAYIRTRIFDEDTIDPEAAKQQAKLLQTLGAHEYNERCENG